MWRQGWDTGKGIYSSPYNICWFMLWYSTHSKYFSPLAGFLSPKSAQENEEFPFKDQMEMMVKRGSVEQCCHKPCNIFDLQNYCNWGLSHHLACFHPLPRSNSQRQHPISKICKHVMQTRNGLDVFYFSQKIKLYEISKEFEFCFCEWALCSE